MEGHVLFYISFHMIMVPDRYHAFLSKVCSVAIWARRILPSKNFVCIRVSLTSVILSCAIGNEMALLHKAKSKC
jgi:hypothetical protein